MELPSAVKGFIENWISTKLGGWNKLELFGESIGVDTSFFDEKRKKDPYFNKNKAAVYIFRNTRKDGENILKSLMRMSKKAEWDDDLSEELMNEINPILEENMKAQIDIDGNLTNIFDDLQGLETQLPIKLRNLGFDTEAANYGKAYKSYSANEKGSLGTVRTALEGVVKSILTRNGENPTTNMKDNIRKLKNIGILQEMDTAKCEKCDYVKRDSEFNNAYDTYSLLSHYANHTGDLTDELAIYLFTSSSALINLIITRHENISNN